MKRKMNPNSLKNLDKFKKGEVHKNQNKKGAPPGLPKLRELLTKVLGEDLNGVTALELILRRQRVKAIAGDQRAAEFLTDRAYGKAVQTIDNLVNGEPVKGFIIKVQDAPPEK